MLRQRWVVGNQGSSSVYRANKHCTFAPSTRLFSGIATTFSQLAIQGHSGGQGRAVVRLVGGQEDFVENVGRLAGPYDSTESSTAIALASGACN